MKKAGLIIGFIALSLTANLTYAQVLKNKVIAHRGAWRTENLPENSIASLNRAIELHCGGSEFDVWMTADGVIVVNHDPTHQGLNVETSTYKELAAKKLKNGETIPTLEEYIAAGQKQKYTKLILEIKTSKISKERTLELAEKCVQTVKRMKAKKLVDYIAFDYDAGLKVIELDKKADVSFLSGNGDVTPAQLKKDGFAGLDYHLNVYKKHPEYIEQARSLGLTTNAWTVDKKEDMKWLLNKGIDFITTDEPETLLQLLKK